MTWYCTSPLDSCCLQVAALIHSLQLERNGATLLLSNLLDEEDGDDDALTRPATKVLCRPATSPACVHCLGHIAMRQDVAFLDLACDDNVGVTVCLALCVCLTGRPKKACKVAGTLPSALLQEQASVPAEISAKVA